MKGSNPFHDGASEYPHGNDIFGQGHDPMWRNLQPSQGDGIIGRMKHHDTDRVDTNPTATVQSSNLSFQEEWKKSLSFLSHYGYDLNSITPKTRIRVIHENSLNSIGGRSAPCACNLEKYLENHPDCRIAFKYEEEKQLPKKYWCKHCGRILDSILPHQVTCSYRKSEIDSSTFPNDVYGFIDSTPEYGDFLDDDLHMSEWLSLIGNVGELFDQHPHLEDELHLVDANADTVDCDDAFKTVINYWLSIASDGTLSIDADATSAIQDCLDLFFASIIEEADEESRRRVGEGERALVPSLVGENLLSNKYLRFISNYGLRKPEPVL